MRSVDMDEFVERVRSQSDIMAVVSNYVPLKKKGNRYWGCCPFHHENTPSFSVVPDKGFFYCFGCHAGGNVFKFISLVENVSYFEAIKLQAEKLNIPVPERKKSSQEIERERRLSDLRRVNEMARDFFHNCLTLTKYGENGRKYLLSRGISVETIKEFQLGFAPNAWDKLLDAFLKRGVQETHLLECGLVLERKESHGFYDKFRNRIMIPIADERGRVVGFGGRVLDQGKPKYLNTQETILFNKRRILFGLDRSHQSIKQLGYAIVVEGYMDAISLFDAGIKNVVASLGTAFTAEQFRLLHRYAPEIYFCYDNDEAGQAAMVRAISLVGDVDARIRVIVVPDGKDPDEFVRKHGADAFSELVLHALSLVEYRMQYVLGRTRHDSLEGKLEAVRQMIPVLASLKGVERTEYVRMTATRLMIDEGIVKEALANHQGHVARADYLKPMAPVRVVVRQKDNGLLKAGRTILRTAWQDPSVLLHVQALLPLEGIADTVQQEILRCMAEEWESGRQLNDILAEELLTEEAARELSMALVEASDEREEAVAYQDSLRMLRRAYLKGLLQRHAQAAEEFLNAGNDAYRKELEEIKRIREEMDDL